MSKKEKAIQYLEKKKDILQKMLSNLKNYELNERLCNRVKQEYREEINLLEYIILKIIRN